MTDRPVIFSAPMVRALLAGRKTQTRRLATSPLRRVEVGDRLWVRENVVAEELHRPPVKRRTTTRERRASERTHVTVPDEMDGADGMRYAADGVWQRIENSAEAGERWSDAFHYGLKDSTRPIGMGLVGKTIPSIHMPRWASRLTLTVEAVRVESLLAIGYDDAIAEGVESRPYTPLQTQWRDYSGADRRLTSSVASFRSLWDSLHTAEGERWQDNPDVVALTFGVERRNIDQEVRHG